MELRRCFDKYDVSRDGLIVFDEFKKAMKESTYTDEEIEALFAGMVCNSEVVHRYTYSYLFFSALFIQDMNGDGLIQYTEFLAATLEARGLIEEERIAEAFDRLDANDTGQITKRELVDFLGEDASSTNIEELMEEWDADGDGMSKYHPRILQHILSADSESSLPYSLICGVQKDVYATRKIIEIGSSQ